MYFSRVHERFVSVGRLRALLPLLGVSFVGNVGWECEGSSLLCLLLLLLSYVLRVLSQDQNRRSRGEGGSAVPIPGCFAKCCVRLFPSGPACVNQLHHNLPGLRRGWNCFALGVPDSSSLLCRVQPGGEICLSALQR